MGPTPLVALVGSGPGVRGAAGAWARCVAGVLGGEVLALPERAGFARALDLVAKREVQWLVRGVGGGPGGALAVPPSPESLREEELLSRLLRRAPCPVLCVQPWAEPPSGPPRVAVVGVDRSSEALRTARAAAELLARAKGSARLILAHGSKDHPDALAADTPWPELVESMRLERHGWIRDLARELRRDELLVEVAVALRWAPDWVSGLARREAADLVALGMRGCGEQEKPSLGFIHRRVLRGSARPVATHG